VLIEKEKSILLNKIFIYARNERNKPKFKRILKLINQLLFSFSPKRVLKKKNVYEKQLTLMVGNRVFNPGIEILDRY